MSVSTPKPKNVNRIGLSRADYTGGLSTLCSGCGHDAVTSQIIKAFYEMGIDPYHVIKMSGIGCSSKTPAYFLSKAHGFNGVHGRMPSLSTGAVLANRQLVCIGVSGDGDTASIGLGQFCHLLRRNVPMIYVIENNGVYGLTKGQFSSTSDIGAKLKTGVVNDMSPIDCCALAIKMGCSYVARSFAGDPKQQSIGDMSVVANASMWSSKTGTGRWRIWSDSRLGKTRIRFAQSSITRDFRWMPGSSLIT